MQINDREGRRESGMQGTGREEERKERRKTKREGPVIKGRVVVAKEEWQWRKR